LSAEYGVARARGLVRRLGGFTLGPLDFELAPGTWTALVGPSGAGKTTLLRLVAGLDVADEGTLRVLGSDQVGASEAARTRLRRRHIGVVFQERYVIEHLTVAENIAVRLVPLGVPERERRARAGVELALLGLAGFEDRRVTTLSGGELQRLAVARACIGAPSLLIADEPTASVDSATAALVLARLEALRATGATLLVSAHDAAARTPADALLTLAAGRRVE
jgi:putative ABC transport system ATP-binding protein